MYRKIVFADCSTSQEHIVVLSRQEPYVWPSSNMAAIQISIVKIMASEFGTKSTAPNGSIVAALVSAIEVRHYLEYPDHKALGEWILPRDSSAPILLDIPPALLNTSLVLSTDSAAALYIKITIGCCESNGAYGLAVGFVVLFISIGCLLTKV